MPRSRLGPLAIESRLGETNQSSVWRAIHVKLKRSIAVKVFSAPFGGTPEARSAFSQEWESLKQIQHPAIVQCFGGGFEATDAYLAYELIEGETLASQIERKTRLSWESVLDFAEPVADALEYLHQQRILHGDIQPDKIMIAGLSPVLLDIRMDRHGTPFKSGGAISAQEMSLRAPEVASDLSSYTHLCDLYALGATMYWAITGDSPISGSSIEEVMGNIEYQEPIPPAQIVLDCPVWLDKLVVQLLQKNPDARPPNAGAVKLALAEVRRRAMSRTGVAEHVSSGFSPLQMTDQKQRDEARSLLGREVVDLDKVENDESGIEFYIPWHDQAPILIGLLVLILAMVAWYVWPDSESDLRAEAERLLALDTHRSLSEAKLEPLREILTRFPDSGNASWAKEQVKYIDARLYLRQLSFKIKNDLPLKNEGEELHKQAQMFATLGDTESAIQKYEGIEVILGDEPEYQVAVEAARLKIDELRNKGVEETEASELFAKALKKGDQLLKDGKVKEARRIWMNLVDSYDNTPGLESLIDEAKSRLARK